MLKATFSSPLTKRLAKLLIAILCAMACVDCQAHESCGCNDKETKLSSSESHTASDTNTMCPVMTDVEAEDLWTTIYRGKKVRFCCNNCVESFRREPEKYLANLPQFAGIEQEESLTGSIASSEGSSSSLSIRVGIMALGFLICFLILGLDQRLVINNGGRKTFLLRAMVAFLLATSATLLWRYHQGNKDLKVEIIKERAKSQVHLATYYDYGVPPVPDNPGLQPALTRSFYRGNDERSPVLFNGGNYQTAKFDLQVEYSDGTAARVGDSIAGQKMFLSFTIRKPKNAPKRMYDPKLMRRMFLTTSYEPTMGWDHPIEDKTPLQVVSEGVEWRCRFPLDVGIATHSSRFNPHTISQNELASIQGVGTEVAQWFVAYRDAGYPITGPDDLRQAGIKGTAAGIISNSLGETAYSGLIYVCEAFFHQQKQLGARFHYGIKYNLCIKDGKLGSGSEIWMGALSRSLKARKGSIPDDQWLNDSPLPALPSQQQISDELLGIDDYEF